MKEETASIDKNEVLELIGLGDGAILIQCKWVAKTKLDSNGNVDRYIVRLVAQRFRQTEGIRIDYNFQMYYEINFCDNELAFT